MSSPGSPSSSAAPASAEEAAFGSYHPRVQYLARTELGWRHLRPIQIQAAAPILAADRDVLIVSATATGKTEAAWMPIFSRLLTDNRGGIGALCVSPLKALINDQAARLGRYGQYL